MKAGAIISEVHRDVMDTKAMIRDVLKNQQEAGGQDRSVSDTCIVYHRMNTDRDHLGSKQVSGLDL